MKKNRTLAPNTFIRIFGMVFVILASIVLLLQLYDLLATFFEWDSVFKKHEPFPERVGYLLLGSYILLLIGPAVFLNAYPKWVYKILPGGLIKTMYKHVNFKEIFSPIPDKIIQEDNDDSK